MKQIKKRFYLPLNIQYFAEPPTEPPIDEPPATEPPSPQEPPIDNKIPYDRFKKKVDEANELKRKLAEIEKERDEAERKKLEEQNEFKTLYEQTQAELETLRNEAHKAQLEATKERLLVTAGYTGEQLNDIREFVNGDDEESLKESLEKIKRISPPTQIGADPSPNNTPRHTPQPKDVKDEAKSFYQRLKESGKLRR